jgi:hypothetical protein
MVAAGVLVLTVSSVVAVRYVHTYASPAAAGLPPASAQTVADGPPALPVDLAQQQRFQAATEFVNKAGGNLAVIVRDRTTGVEWRAGGVERPFRASSTVKLAIAANLLERSRSGEIKLDTTAHRNIADMLETSSDRAADALWDRYGRETMVQRLQQRYGMARLEFSPGALRRWNNLRCVPDDLLHLVTYLLDHAVPADRDYLTAAMRRTGAVQHWGVWAAGAPNQPGVSNAWTLATDGKVKHWVTHSIGFAGPDGRYAVVVMFDQPAGGTLDAGVHAVSDVVATMFGAPTPADVTVPGRATGR